MIDNFEQIGKLLKWDSDDEFYFVQILQRKKDNPGGVHGANNSSRLIKAYYITSLEQLNNLKEEIIVFATYFNARVGINLNKRSFYKTAFSTLEKIAAQMQNKSFKDVRRAYNTACGIHNSETDKFWIIDIDHATETDPKMLQFIDYDCMPFNDTSKIRCIIPSKSGLHLITKPFNLKTFSDKYPDIDIQKNNPTNLYIP